MLTHRPVIALAMGDPAGISPELTARILVDEDISKACRLIVIGDRRVLQSGANTAGLHIHIKEIAHDTPILECDDNIFMINLGHCDPQTIKQGAIGIAGGRFAMTNFKFALQMVRNHLADAVCFTPFNKSSMRLMDPKYEDEIIFTKEYLKLDVPASEFNVLDRLWNARVTSHVALKDVSSRISKDAIIRGLILTSNALKAAGFNPARIGVAALNPHAGDNGNFGREEIDIIEPAVQEAQAMGINCAGPFPSDTVFVRAKNNQFDAVLTMYHDQGQIAIKLLGFDQGVTMLGGFPFPICTAAHGTAFEIAGKGVAHPGASRNAVLLAAKMAMKNPIRVNSSLSSVKDVNDMIASWDK